MNANIIISIHAPPRGATLPYTTIIIHLTHFNSRPSARGDPKCALLHPSSIFQFTPLREGRHAEAVERLKSAAISIHAPPRGATSASAVPSSSSSNFNSRPSARGDRGRPIVNAKYLLISIHAPPRGATSRALLVARKLHLFQFTPLREGRRLTKSWRKSLILFQFTPLREGRLKGE